MDDYIYVVTMLRNSADLAITSGSVIQHFTVSEGLSTVSIPFQQGAQVS